MIKNIITKYGCKIMKDDLFGTAINCIDGRVQLPVLDWLKRNYSVRYVDTITEPGVDRVFSETNVDRIQQLKSKVMISMNAHGSSIVVISGHHECAGNPVTKNEHLNHIKSASEIIKSWNLPVKVVGLWVNENWEVEVVT